MSKSTILSQGDLDGRKEALQWTIHMAQVDLAGGVATGVC